MVSSHRSQRKPRTSITSARSRRRGVPLILFDRSNDELEVSHVVIDDFLGAYKATEHLYTPEGSRIAHFTSIGKLSIYKERLRGYREALANNDIAYNPELVIESNLQVEDGRASMLKLLSAKVRPDVSIRASAFGAMGAMPRAERKAGAYTRAGGIGRLQQRNLYIVYRPRLEHRRAAQYAHRQRRRRKYFSKRSLPKTKSSFRKRSCSNRAHHPRVFSGKALDDTSIF